MFTFKLEKKLFGIFKTLGVFIVPHSKSGIVPRSSLLRRWAVGSGEFGKGGIVG